MKKIYSLLILALILPLTQLNAQEEKEEGFTFGGAVRYNLLSTNYEGQSSSPLNTGFTWDTWRLNVDGSYAGVDLSFEYRWYPTFGTHFIHHGFLGYSFSDNIYMELGVTQVPFGITTYASHSWWFQGPYYVGLEDDYDMGVNFDFTPSDKLKLSVAYFRQAEPEGPYLDFGLGRYNVTFGNAGPGRYSYDITPGSGGIYNETTETVDMVDANIREINQFNVRLAYSLNESWEIGASGQFGGNYNAVQDEYDMSTALAGHLVGNFGNFNLKTEYVYYNYKAQSDVGEALDIVQMGAYGSAYNVASEASMYVAGLAYSIDVDWGPISNIQPYVDYTYVDKANENFYNTQHLIPGFLITAGKIYTYVDYAMGKNQPWLTNSFGTGLGQGLEDPAWNSRLNINIGYYF